MPGKKDSQTIDKPAMKYLVPEFMLMMGDGLKHGEKKYGPENWKDYPLCADDYRDARLRHAFKNGKDKDTGLPHLVHEALCCMMQWWHENNKSIQPPLVNYVNMGSNYDDEKECVNICKYNVDGNEYVFCIDCKKSSPGYLLHCKTCGGRFKWTT